MENNQEASQALTLIQAAQELGISRPTLMKLIRAVNQLPENQEKPILFVFSLLDGKTKHLTPQDVERLRKAKSSFFTVDIPQKGAPPKFGIFRYQSFARAS